MAEPAVQCGDASPLSGMRFPISDEIFEDPVILTETGHTFDHRRMAYEICTGCCSICMMGQLLTFDLARLAYGRISMLLRVSAEADAHPPSASTSQRP
ncbi:hypothetical protein WJX74_009432 [Apatococcus lobatus]|uniref:Uncharacterized protein n=1 Tax=Apatococcus lobatus TaxID=904363 RepID=A0AAW1SBR8_9CHLO